MTKKCILVFSTHHTSGNIASLRFKLLSKHIASSECQIHIFSQKSRNNDKSSLSIETPNIHIHEIACPSSTISRLISLLFTLFSSFFHSLPTFIALQKTGRPTQNWLIGAVTIAEEIAADMKRQGYDIVTIGTYSPVDALVAAKAVSQKCKTSCILDFRDGFAFESRGRKGAIYSMLRKIIERSLISDSDLITSVSMPLISYFKQHYAKNRVEYLPNGFDRSEFTAEKLGQRTNLAKNIDDIFESNHIIIGHFGRISGSDTSRLDALGFLIESINNFQGSIEAMHLVFIGNLQEQDLSLLKRLKCRTTIIPHLPREDVLRIMGRCNFLLLITGNLTSCATGKLFEYMASGPEIICVSGVENEASQVIRMTNCGKTLLVGDSNGATAMLRIIANGDQITNGPRGNTEIFEKPHQASLLIRWINEISREEIHLSATEN